MTENISSLCEKNEKIKRKVWVGLIVISVIIVFFTNYNFEPKPNYINRWLLEQGGFGIVKLNSQEYLIVELPAIKAKNFGDALQKLILKSTELKLEDNFRKGIIEIQKEIDQPQME